MASLRVVGIFFSIRDLLIILWIICSRVGSRCLTREVGIGSSSQDAELHFWIIADNFSSDISLNSLKHVPLNLFSACELFELFSPEKVPWSVPIFSLKKV